MFGVMLFNYESTLFSFRLSIVDIVNFEVLEPQIYIGDLFDPETL